MISKSKIKFVRSLHFQKYRIRSGLFIAEGPKLVQEILESDLKIESIYGIEEWENRYVRIPDKTDFHKISKTDLLRISALKTPNEVLAVVQMPTPQKPSIPNDNLILALEDIHDPGNLGTIIRTADWFGITGMICSESCVDVFNPKVVQATMGSIVRVSVYYTNLKDYIKELPAGFPVYGTLLNGESIYSKDLADNGIIIIGSESHGLSQDIFPLINHQITIPGFSEPGRKSAESLNASVAAAIILSEFRRRRWR